VKFVVNTEKSVIELAACVVAEHELRTSLGGR
jgi:hypothetical protein